MSFELEDTELVAGQARLKRNRLAIAANILTIAKTGALKTHLMYNGNLSYSMLRNYLNFLHQNELLDESYYPNDKTTLYHTTEKGVRFLESYLVLNELATPTAMKESLIAQSAKMP